MSSISRALALPPAAGAGGASGSSAKRRHIERSELPEAVALPSAGAGGISGSSAKRRCIDRSELPEAVLVKIFSCLSNDDKALGRAAQVSRDYKAAVLATVQHEIAAVTEAIKLFVDYLDRTKYSAIVAALTALEEPVADCLLARGDILPSYKRALFKQLAKVALEELDRLTTIPAFGSHGHWLKVAELSVQAAALNAESPYDHCSMIFLRLAFLGESDYALHMIGTLPFPPGRKRGLSVAVAAGLARSGEVAKALQLAKSFKPPLNNPIIYVEGALYYLTRGLIEEADGLRPQFSTTPTAADKMFILVYLKKGRDKEAEELFRLEDKTYFNWVMTDFYQVMISYWLSKDNEGKARAILQKFNRAEYRFVFMNFFLNKKDFERVKEFISTISDADERNKFYCTELVPE